MEFQRRTSPAAGSARARRQPAASSSTTRSSSATCSARVRKFMKQTRMPRSCIDHRGRQVDAAVCAAAPMPARRCGRSRHLRPDGESTRSDRCRLVQQPNPVRCSIASASPAGMGDGPISIHPRRRGRAVDPNASHSFSDRTGREYSSVLSTGFAMPRVRACTPSWAKACGQRTLARPSITRLQLFCTPIHLCASIVRESAPLEPRELRRDAGTPAAGAP